MDSPDSSSNCIMHGTVWHTQAWQTTCCLVTFQQWRDKQKVSFMIQVVHNVPVLQTDEINTNYRSQISREHAIVSFFSGSSWRQLSDILTNLCHWLYYFFQNNCNLKFPFKTSNIAKALWFYFFKNYYYSGVCSVYDVHLK